VHAPVAAIARRRLGVCTRFASAFSPFRSPTFHSFPFLLLFFRIKALLTSRPTGSRARQRRRGGAAQSVGAECAAGACFFVSFIVLKELIVVLFFLYFP
jgi:hypothetical protein